MGKEEFVHETFVSLLIAWVNEGGNVENYFKRKNLEQFGSGEKRVVEFVLEMLRITCCMLTLAMYAMLDEEGNIDM